jgi:hypothetical protein
MYVGADVLKFLFKLWKFDYYTTQQFYFCFYSVNSPIFSNFLGNFGNIYIKKTLLITPQTHKLNLATCLVGTNNNKPDT